ncbi:MAG: hypothetical protein WC829_11285 [Hyphomicrobium sp.]|jgi:hypothetical protein
MQALGTFDLYLNIFIAIWFPLLILVNLKNWGERSPFNSYLWRMEPGLMRMSLVLVAIMAAYAGVRLAVQFGLLPSTRMETALAVLAVPFLLGSVAELWLGGRALVRYMRSRPSAARP